MSPVYVKLALHKNRIIWVLENVKWTLHKIEDDAKQIADFKLKTDIDVIGTIPYYFYGTAMNEMLAKKICKSYKKILCKFCCKMFWGKISLWKFAFLYRCDDFGIRKNFVIIC